MNQPYKHELRSEIAQLREDLFILIEACKDNDVVFPILVRNQWYYGEKFNREIEEQLFAKYGRDDLKVQLKGIDSMVETYNNGVKTFNRANV